MCVLVHNEALAHLPYSTPTEYTFSMFGSVVATLPRAMGIVLSNSYDVVYSLLPQQTRKLDQPLPFSSSLMFSVFNQSYRCMIFIYLLRLSQTRRTFPPSRYVFGIIIDRYRCHLTYAKGPLPRIPSDAQDVASLAPFEARRESP